jgi:hypothetical protein
VVTGGATVAITMLSENAIIDAVCKHLLAQGFDINQSLNTKQRGIDIIAVKDGFTLYVEAKGETSDRIGSQRFGKAFDASQVRDHVANAFYCAAAMLQKAPSSKPVRAGIALPDERLHRDRIAAVQKALQTLGIPIFWVSPGGSVRVDGQV